MAKRARFSTFLWPSLYSLRAIGIVIAMSFAFALLCIAIKKSLEAPRQILLMRTAERRRAIIALKLSGVESWQWRKEFSCENQKIECLKVKLHFTPTETQNFTEQVSAPVACAICHSRELATAKQFIVEFLDVPHGQGVTIPNWLVFAVALCPGFAFCIYLIYLRLARKRKGICIAALYCAEQNNPTVKLLCNALENSRRVAYYCERDATRLRWATTVEKFHAWLALNQQILSENKTQLKIVAMHVDLNRQTYLPIEILRGIFQFLTQCPAGQYLLHERLFSEEDRNSIKMRRLVFKNKSGASLKFFSWEFS